MLKISEFDNNHPFGMKMLVKFIRWGIRKLDFLNLNFDFLTMISLLPGDDQI